MAASTSEHPLMRLPLGQHMGVVQPSQTYTCPGYPSWVENVPQNRGRESSHALAPFTHPMPQATANLPSSAPHPCTASTAGAASA